MKEVGLKHPLGKQIYSDVIKADFLYLENTSKQTLEYYKARI